MHQKTPETAPSDVTIVNRNQSIFSFKQFMRFIPFNALLILSMYMSITFQAGYGAAWFGGCKTIEEDNNCDKKLDYDAYNFYLQISNSITGALSFLFAAFIGCVIDIYGAKIFLYFQLFTTWIPFIAILFYNNFYVYFALLTIKGINGSAQILCPAQTTYITLSLPSEKRLTGFATMYVVAAITLLMGTGASFAVSALVSDHFNFYIINILFAISFIYLLRFVHKQKTNNNTETETKLRCNPFRPFLYLRRNSVCLYISLSSSFVTLQIQGITDIIVVVYNDVLGSSESQSNVLSMVLIAGITVGMMVGPIVVLPILRKFNVSEYKILIGGLVLTMCNMCIMCSILMVKQLWLMAVSSFISGIEYLCFAAYQSLLTAHCNEKETGTAYGVMFACHSVMSIIAPFGFAVMYQYFKQRDRVYIMFLVGFMLTFIALLFTIPLKTAMLKHSKWKQKRIGILHDKDAQLLCHESVLSLQNNAVGDV